MKRYNHAIIPFHLGDVEIIYLKFPYFSNLLKTFQFIDSQQITSIRVYKKILPPNQPEEWTFFRIFGKNVQTMSTSVKSDKNQKKRDPGSYWAKIKESVSHESSIDIIAWNVLGGKSFMSVKPASFFDFVVASEKGIRKLSVENLAGVLDIPMADMAALLSVSYKTLGRKKSTDILDELSSSMSIEIANTVAKGISVFEDRDKFNRWLQKENKALKNKKPLELLNTPTGIKLVNQLLIRIEEGVYS